MDKRVRSPNYPALGLPEAIEKIGGIYRNLHNHAGPREVIAKAMGYTGLNGASATAISALHKYGLLERTGDDNKVSDRAMRIMHPHSPSERTEAIKEAAYAPALFAELKERFTEKHPNDDLLRNYLVRKQFAPAALTAVISAYRETSEMVDRENEGHAWAVDHTGSTPQMSQLPHHPTAAQLASHSSLSAEAFGGLNAERSIGRYDFEGGGFVRISASSDLDTEEALDMVETLVQLKRKEIARTTKLSNSSASQVNADPANTLEPK